MKKLIFFSLVVFGFLFSATSLQGQGLAEAGKNAADKMAADKAAQERFSTTDRPQKADTFIDRAIKDGGVCTEIVQDVKVCTDGKGAWIEGKF